jgi:hypothetical protein
MTWGCQTGKPASGLTGLGLVVQPKCLGISASIVAHGTAPIISLFCFGLYSDKTNDKVTVDAAQAIQVSYCASSLIHSDLAGMGSLQCLTSALGLACP